MQGSNLDGVFKIHKRGLLRRFAAPSLPYSCDGAALCEAKDCVGSNCFEVRILFLILALFCFILFHVDEPN